MFLVIVYIKFWTRLLLAKMKNKNFSNTLNYEIIILRRVT